MPNNELFIIEYEDGEIDDSGNFGGFTVFLDRPSAEEMLDCTEEPTAKVVRFVREDTIAALEARVKELEADKAKAETALSRTSVHPTHCPVTGRPFFMVIEAPSGDMVATYGGPFDSYTIPEWDEDDQEFRSERFDHDRDEWIDGGEPYSFIRVDEQEWFRLQDKVAALEAELAEAKRLGAAEKLEELAERFAQLAYDANAGWKLAQGTSYAMAKNLCLDRAARLRGEAPVVDLPDGRRLEITREETERRAQ